MSTLLPKLITHPDYSVSDNGHTHLLRGGGGGGGVFPIKIVKTGGGAIESFPPKFSRGKFWALA